MSKSHVYQVQIGRDTTKSRGKYRTKYEFKNRNQAVAWYNGINVGFGYKKRLLQDGKVIARCFS